MRTVPQGFGSVFYALDGTIKVFGRTRKGNCFGHNFGIDTLYDRTATENPRIRDVTTHEVGPRTTRGIFVDAAGKPCAVFSHDGVSVKVRAKMSGDICRGSDGSHGVPPAAIAASFVSRPAPTAGRGEWGPAGGPRFGLDQFGGSGRVERCVESLPARLPRDRPFTNSGFPSRASRGPSRRAVSGSRRFESGVGSGLELVDSFGGHVVPLPAASLRRGDCVAQSVVTTQEKIKGAMHYFSFDKMSRPCARFDILSKCPKRGRKCL